MNFWKIVKTPQYGRAVRMVARLRPTPGPITNVAAWQMLEDHYLKHMPKDCIASEWGPKEKSTIMKLLAKNEGEQSSRRADVRRIFFNMCKELGVDVDVNQEQLRSKGKGKGTHPAVKRGIRPLFQSIGGGVVGYAEFPARKAKKGKGKKAKGSDE